jgi:hypothetical protein
MLLIWWKTGCLKGAAQALVFGGESRESLLVANNDNQS